MGEILDKIMGRDSPDVLADGGDYPASAVDTDRAAVEARIKAFGADKRGRGRPRKNPEHDGAGADAEDSTASRKEALKLARELEKLFDPKHWRSVVRVPADVRLAITGREHWRLSESEIDSLSETASVAARQFLQVDPKMLAAILLLFNVATVYGSRLVLDVQMMKKEPK